MERKQFLILCQKYSMGEDLIVLYDDIKYHPKSYMLEFDRKGNPQHTAILKYRFANSIIHCDLEKVKEI